MKRRIEDTRVHFYDPVVLNGTLCGGHPIVTTHVLEVTCPMCRRWMAKRGYFGDFIFHLATEPARHWQTFSR